MHITWGGVLFLIVIGVVVVGIIMFNRWRHGKGLSLPHLPERRKRKSGAGGLTHCLNVYEESIVGEEMLEASVCKNVRRWELNGKQYAFQGEGKGGFTPLALPVDIIFPPERVARMIGCEPYRKLKALKYSWLEQLAPLAPVFALGIGALLFIMVLGD